MTTKCCRVKYIQVTRILIDICIKIIVIESDTDNDLTIATINSDPTLIVNNEALMEKSYGEATMLLSNEENNPHSLKNIGPSTVPVTIALDIVDNN